MLLLQVEPTIQISLRTFAHVRGQKKTTLPEVWRPSKHTAL